MEKNINNMIFIMEMNVVGVELRKMRQNLKIFYDIEFYEIGLEEFIRFISLGVVCEDGEKLYLIINNLYVFNRVNENLWLVENVISYLLVKQNGDGSFFWDIQYFDYVRVLFNEVIVGLWRDFVLDYDECDYFDKFELWVYYGVYDYVVVSQFFGCMIDLLDDMLMYMMDLKQCWYIEGMFVFFLLEGLEYNVFDDVMWNKVVLEYLDFFKG